MQSIAVKDLGDGKAPRVRHALSFEHEAVPVAHSHRPVEPQCVIEACGHELVPIAEQAVSGERSPEEVLVAIGAALGARDAEAVRLPPRGMRRRGGAALWLRQTTIAASAEAGKRRW